MLRVAVFDFKSEVVTAFLELLEKKNKKQNVALMSSYFIMNANSTIQSISWDVEMVSENVFTHFTDCEKQRREEGRRRHLRGRRREGKAETE